MMSQEKGKAMLLSALQPSPDNFAKVIDRRGCGQYPTQFSRDLGIQISHLILFPNEGMIFIRLIETGKRRKGPRTAHNLIQLIDV